MWWPSPTMNSRRRCRCSTSAAAGSAVSADGSSRNPAIPGTPPQARLVEQFLTQFYGAEAELGGARQTNPAIRCPARCWCRACRPTPRNWPLGCPGCVVPGWRCGCRSGATSTHWPRRCTATPEEALQQHKLKRAGDFTARSAALQNIQESLGLAEAPLRIECVDISHVQGTDVVGSLVVFEDGLPRKSDYRHFAIREAAGEGRSDDVASIAEVTRRRFLRHVADACRRRPAPDSDGRPRRFAYPPNLYVVDGGAAQVNAAQAVLDELGVTDVAVIGLAKRLEEVWVPGRTGPGDPAAQQRGAVPAAAGSRRGAPLRDLLPPQ